MDYLSYEATQAYLTDYWWLNPQAIESFEDKYDELVAQSNCLHPDPQSAFRLEVKFFAFSTLFGEDFFTFNEARKYSSKAYSKLKNHVDLQSFYKSLRLEESRLPSAPYVAYKDQWVSWAEFFNIRQLEVVSTYYSLTELRIFCVEKYAEQDKKPVNLQKFFQSFKHENEKIPKNPFTFYRKTGDWVSWKDLFGLETDEWVSFHIAQEFCIKMYQKDIEKPTNLAAYYLALRARHQGEIRLPRHPETYYAKKGEWQSFKALFGVV